MKETGNWIVALTLWMVGLTAVVAQPAFRRLGLADGLRVGTVSDLKEDERGFVWMGTSRGLVRFDGSSATVFDRRTCPSLPGSVVTKVLDDGHGGFWLQTSGGICHFDRRTLSAEQLHPVDRDGHRVEDAVLYEVRDGGKLYLASGSDVYLCDPENNGRCTLLVVRPLGMDRRYAPALLGDGSGGLWLGFPNRGIWHGDGRRAPVLLGEHAHTPLQLVDYSADTLMVGTLTRGVWMMNKHTGESRKLGIPDQSDDNIFAHAFLRVSKREWWIGTETGIYVMRDGAVGEHLSYDAYDPLSISDDCVRSLLMDSRGGVWVGTEKGGVCYMPSGTDGIRRSVSGSRCQWLHGRHVTALAETSDGTLWVGTDDGGLSGTGPAATKNWPLTSPHVKALLARGHELWVATYTGGLNVIDTKTGQVRWYGKTSAPGSLKNQEDVCLTEDSSGRLWVGTTTDVFGFDDRTEQFTPIEGVEGWVEDLVADGANGLWIATRKQGLLHYDIHQKTLKAYTYIEGDSSSVCRGSLTCLLIDHDGRLWIGSAEDGLCMMDRQTGRCRHMDETNGLPEGAVCSLQEDADGDIWVSTTYGLALLDVEKWTTGGVWCRRHWQDDAGFSPRASLLTSKGELCWGCTNGFVSFVPSALLRPSPVYTPLVTDVFFPQGGTDGFLTPAALDVEDGELVMRQGSATFGVRLSALDYVSGNGGKMEYRLLGSGSDGWVTVLPGGTAQWTDLRQGRYELVARYAADGRTWSDEVVCLHIHVLPPWWLTTWAWVLYALLAAALAWIIWKWMRRRRLAELQRERREWEAKAKDESVRARINFFTHVAHEIRTPVSLIRASVEQGVTEENQGMLERNVDRLTNLVNTLLEFRRMESDVQPVVCSEVDVTATIRSVLESFSPMIQQKGLLVSNPKTSDIYAECDEQALQTILTNLLSNAVKYAEKHISVDVHIDSEDVVLTVWNDGQPIEPELCERIFEPFVKGEHADNPTSTGIGLSLVRLLVKKMQGSVDVCSDDKGTAFTIRLRKIQTQPLFTPDGESNADPFVTQSTTPSSVSLLIVEDNDDMRDYLRRQFSSVYNVLTASDGQEAWALLSQTDVSLIVSDVMMPRMDGFELCRRIKSTLLTCHIPVVLLTAKTTEQEHVQGYGYGADAYVDKPFSTGVLMAQVESILLNRKRQQKHFLSATPLVEPKPESKSEEPIMVLTELDQKFADRLNAYISEHLSEEDFNIDALASHMSMSRRNFHRKMKALSGCTPGDYIHACRMRRAGELLATRRYRVGEVGLLVGFHSMAHFSRAFQKYYGVTPSNYS